MAMRVMRFCQNLHDLLLEPPPDSPVQLRRESIAGAEGHLDDPSKAPRSHAPNRGGGCLGIGRPHHDEPSIAEDALRHRDCHDFLEGLDAKHAAVGRQSLEKIRQPMAQTKGRHKIQAPGKGRKNARLSARVLYRVRSRVEIHAPPVERRSRVGLEEEWFLFRHLTAYCFELVGMTYWLNAVKKSSLSLSGDMRAAPRSDCSDWFATYATQLSSRPSVVSGKLLLGLQLQNERLVVEDNGS